jgi:ADP-ribose pyrophosphatase
LIEEDKGEGEFPLPLTPSRQGREDYKNFCHWLRRSMLKPEKTLSTRQIYQGRAVNIRVDTVEKASGTKTTREVVEHSDCVAVVAVDAQGNILLVRQFRHPVGKFLLEIPAGGIDPGEEPIDSVRRELQEEIGYFPRKIEKLGGFYTIPGYGTEYLHCFLATDLVSARLVAEDTEDIELIRVPREEIPRLVASGEICDAKSIAALLTFLYIPENK